MNKISMILILAFLVAPLVSESSAQSASNVNATQIQKMVDDIISASSKEMAQEDSQTGENSNLLPTQVCKQAYRNGAVICKDDEACKGRIADQLKSCISEAMTSVGNVDVSTTLKSIDADYAAAQTVDDCQKVLEQKERCGLNEDCRKRVLKGFDFCGQRIMALKGARIHDQNSASKGNMKAFAQAAHQGILSQKDLNKLNFHHKIQHHKARIEALKKEIESANTKLQLLEEKYKRDELKIIIEEKRKETYEAQKVIEHKNILDFLDASLTQARTYRDGAVAMDDVSKLADLAGISLKMSDLEKSVKAKYMQWLKDYHDKVSEAESFDGKVTPLKKDIQAQISKVQAKKQAMDLQEKNKNDVKSLYLGYSDAMKVIRDRILKTTDFGEADRSLTDLQGMQTQSAQKYAEYTSRYNEKISEVEALSKTIDSYIAESTNVRDGLLAKKSNEQAAQK